MKKKLLTIVFAILVFSIPLLSVVNGQSISSVLKDLGSELKTSFLQRAEAQKQFDKDYEREHKRMVDIITASNELSLLLYTQEQDKTFDLAYALHKVTSAYKDFSKDSRPYDRSVHELNVEVDRYARLIEALRRLPPVLTEIELELVPDSLQYHNDSLDWHISEMASTLEKEVIRIAISFCPGCQGRDLPGFLYPLCLGAAQDARGQPRHPDGGQHALPGGVLAHERGLRLCPIPL